MSGGRKAVRHERLAEAKRLREQGLSIRAIAETMGYSRGYVGALFSDPDGVKDAARKARHLGRPVLPPDYGPDAPEQKGPRLCTEGCGTRLNVYNTSGVCGACTVELSRRRVAEALAASRQKEEAA